MNLENIAKKISVEIECDIITAQRMAEQLTKIHSDLRPVVSAWLKDDLINFEFEGITLDMIMNKEHTPYIKAVFSMNVLLSNPHFAAQYSDMKFAADDTEG